MLIADDSQDFRHNLQGILDKEESVEVVTEAADGQATLEQAGADRPEVVLMDIELAVMGGIEATRKICIQWVIGSFGRTKDPTLKGRFSVLQQIHPLQQRRG